MKPILFTLRLTVIALTVQGVIAAESSAFATNRNDASNRPPQLISEVIPIKYASASEIADALNSLRRRSNSNKDRLLPLLQRASTSITLPMLDHVEAIADVRSNSLLIFATQSELETIKLLVPRLDLALPQILIEAAVIEVTLPEFKVGAARRAGQRDQPDFFSRGGVLTNVSILWSTNFVSSETTKASDNKADGFRYVTKVDADLDSTLAALNKDRRMRIIMKPRIQTSQATSATVFLGSLVPGSVYPSPDLGGPHGCSQLRIGVGLQVTPLFDSNGHIKMQLCQTVDKITGYTIITGVGDVPNTESIVSRATVTVRDGEMFILSGWQFSREKSGEPDPSTTKPAFYHISRRNPRHELFILARATILPESNELSTGKESHRSN